MQTTIENRSDFEKYPLPNSKEYKFDDVPIDDPRVWALYQNADVKGLFQVESQLCKEWCKKIKPKNIDDLSALISLVRPGGLGSGMAEKYANIKNGEEEESYLHIALKPILEKTYSCLVFQESILRICVDIAGFNETQADDARKAVGKKLPEEMDKVRKMFMEGAEQKAIVSKEVAEEIFSWIQKSVRYLFNASHSYSYAYTSYFTAYQKRFFPTEFYASALTYSGEKINPKEEIFELVQDARMHNVLVRPPDIRQKNVDFKILEDKEILFGLSHIRMVGASAISRLHNIHVDNFNNFLKATPIIHRNVAEALIKSGACDYYNLSRNIMLRHVYVMLGQSDTKENEETKENEINPDARKLSPIELKYILDNLDELGLDASLQSILDKEICIAKRIPAIQRKIEFLRSAPEDTNRQNSIWEKLYLGLSLTCSAAEDFDKIEKNTHSCRQAISVPDRTNIVMHVVIDKIDVRRLSEKSKNPGAKYCYLNVSDNTLGIKGLVCWNEVFDELEKDLREGLVVTVYGRKSNWKGKDQIVVNKIKIIG